MLDEGYHGMECYSNKIQQTRVNNQFRKQILTVTYKSKIWINHRQQISNGHEYQTVLKFPGTGQLFFKIPPKKVHFVRPVSPRVLIGVWTPDEPSERALSKQGCDFFSQQRAHNDPRTHTHTHSNTDRRDFLSVSGVSGGNQLLLSLKMWSTGMATNRFFFFHLQSLKNLFVWLTESRKRICSRWRN